MHPLCSDRSRGRQIGSQQRRLLFGMPAALLFEQHDTSQAGEKPFPGQPWAEPDAAIATLIENEDAGRG